MVKAEQVLNALRQVQDPDLKVDVVRLGFIKDLCVQDGHVRFAIELTTPACPVREQMRSQAQAVVEALPGVSGVDISMRAQVRSSNVGAGQEPGNRLRIKHIVAIASGKGGVGKSTVCVNLAIALAKVGAKVGLMDADIYGPTVPALLNLSGRPQVDSSGRLSPHEKAGMKVVSLGFFMRPKEAVVWRGPMLHKTVQQFLGGVHWGELDYLLVDTPPGTGDVSLSLCQTMPISGAVVVSTPQDIALQVAARSVAMFRKLNTHVLGVIENMSAYVCPHCGKAEEIFGSGGAERMAAEFGVPLLGNIPLSSPVRLASDSGEPIVISAPESAAAKAFIQAAERLAAQISLHTIKNSSPA